MDSYNIIAGTFGLGRFVNRSAAYQAIRKTVSLLVTESRQHPVLIFDKAHYLHNEILKELRLLTNYKMDSENRLCLLLVGHTELRRWIMISAQASLAQCNLLSRAFARINVSWLFFFLLNIQTVGFCGFIPVLILATKLMIINESLEITPLAFYA